MLNPFTNRRILKNGVEARATIVDMPVLDGGPKPVNVAMVLRIDRAGEHPYEIRDHFMISGDEGLEIDDVIHVAVDRGNPHRLVIDWDKTRDAIDRRQTAVNQVMEPGVPLPVTRVRDAIEEVDPGHFERRRTQLAEPAANGSAPMDDEVDGRHDGSLPASAAEDLTSALERLAALHAAGALTDGEFAAAKSHVLPEA
jgi:Short C-terminal domain